MKLTNQIRRDKRVRAFFSEYENLRPGKNDWWIYLKAGYCCEPFCHTIHEKTLRDAARALSLVEVCDCSECLSAKPAKTFKVGDWWKTRSGGKVMIWEILPVETEEWGKQYGMRQRPMRCAFHGGGMANYPRNGIFNHSGEIGSDSDLIEPCEAPKEFKRNS